MVSDEAHSRSGVHPLALSLTALRRFAGERFPPWAAVPLGALLYGAPASLKEPAPLEVAAGVLATCLGLLCLRIADDLSDLKRDRALHPQRGLSCGAIDPARLRDANLGLAIALLALESTSMWRFTLFVGACAHYGAWFSYGRARVHPVARPFLSNLVFPCAVFHGAGPSAWRPAILLALYAWFAAVAHEFAHNVRSPEEDGPLGPGYARALGARGTAALGTALFATAALVGTLLWLELGRPPAFGGALVGAAAGLTFFLAQQLRDPGPGRARALYRAGIILALVPPLGLLVGR
jgi:4-hydroxybenzoate polyprenyltransferase